MSTEKRIEKPKDAVPLLIDFSDLDLQTNIGKTEYMFTAKECAQIALAFLDCAKAVDTGAYGAEEEFDQWHERFAEWGEPQFLNS